VSGHAPEPPSWHESAIHGLLAAARDALRLEVEALESATALRVVGHILPGEPLRGILQVAADIDADLIVVGTHRRSSVRRFMLRSVAERVLRQAHCPVLVAMRRDHARLVEESVIEPPCSDCLAARARPDKRSGWCQRHSRIQLRSHIYEPSDRRPPVTLVD
jgi:hypothetical protein